MSRRFAFRRTWLKNWVLLKKGCRKPCPRTRIRLETLEPRHLCAADVRTFDGTGNNLMNFQWGSTEEAYLRVSPAAYGDGISSPSGSTRLSPREISNRIVQQGTADLVNDRNLSAFVYAWGQFLDHDIDLTETASPIESFSISIPKGDPAFDPTGSGAMSLPLFRSEYDSRTGTSGTNPRQQINSISAFIDGSQVYGSSAERAAALRTFQGGKLLVSDGNLLPFNTMGLENAALPGSSEESFFVAGDIRANENIELTAMHTLFVREHNRMAEKIGKANPTWSDEQIYQGARRWVIAEIQSITYNEFLPAILGAGAMSRYVGYNPRVNPGITNEFAAAAFRFGHSMLGTDIEFLDNDGNEVHDAVSLRESFFSPQRIVTHGIDEIMKYLASDRAQEIDVHIVDDLRDFLFGPPGSGGMDLAALNIQRGRDHGLSDYNSVRVAYGLRPIRSFAEITRDPQLQQALAKAYGSVHEIDLWVGGLAEDHLNGSSMGPLFTRILADQFQRLRDGDRFWYEREFRGAELAELRSTTLAMVIKNNTTTQNLQANVFEFATEIRGLVFRDSNANGRSDLRETGIGGIVVQLLDSSGTVLATTTTDRQGGYRFQRLDLGTYRVRILLPTAMRQTTSNPSDIIFTKGRIQSGVSFGIANATSRLASGLSGSLMMQDPTTRL